MRRNDSDCSVDGCESRKKSNGMCPKHEQRWKKYGTPHLTSFRGRYSVKIPTFCKVIDCAKRSHLHGYCNMHSLRLLRNGTTDALVRQVKACSWDGCATTGHGAYCSRHQKQLDTNRRRARKKSAPSHPYTSDQMAQRIAYWGDKCWMCGGAYEALDHVIPLSRGGADCLANLRPACGSCNSRKHNKWFGVAGLHQFVKT
jgi:5-methylcytosine-specific restriction endonuclease McrA